MPPKAVSMPISKQEYMKYFAHTHLPEGIAREISSHFYDLGVTMYMAAEELSKKGFKIDVAEFVAARRKLVEAKDCAVRSFLCL